MFNAAGQVNTAARMCKLAAPDSVLCAAPLAAALRSAAPSPVTSAGPPAGVAFRCTSRGTVHVKGKGPMETFHVAIEARPPVRRAPSAHGPSFRRALMRSAMGPGGAAPAPAAGGLQGGGKLRRAAGGFRAAPRKRMSVLDFFAREAGPASPAEAAAGARRGSTTRYLSPEGRAWALDPAHRIGPALVFADRGWVRLPGLGQC